MAKEEIREAIASEIHAIWAHWMDHLFSVCLGTPKSKRIISLLHFKRWQRQMKTPYNELTEEEKESDREQADKLLALFEITEKENA